MKSIKELSNPSWPMTKGQLAESLYAGKTYDCALPQSFYDVSNQFECGHLFVWGYDENDAIGKPWPLCSEAADILKLLDKGIDRPGMMIGNAIISGDYGQYRTFRVSTRFAPFYEWFTTDALNHDELGLPSVIRQCPTKEDAMQGL